METNSTAPYNTEEWSFDDIGILTTIVDASKIPLAIRTLEEDEQKLSEQEEAIRRKRKANQHQILLLRRLIDILDGTEPPAAEPTSTRETPLQLPQVAGQSLQTRRPGERSQNVQEFIREKDGWLYRTEFEQELNDSKLNALKVTDPDSVREEVRQILKRARDASAIIERKVYTLTNPNNRVTTTLVYGIKEFVSSPKSNAFYEKKLSQYAKEWGLFLTREEAEIARHAMQQSLFN